MLPDDFRKLFLEKDDGDIVRDYIVNDDPGPYLPVDALRQIESVIRAKFLLAPDQRVSAILVGSAKLGFSFLEKRVDDVVVKPAYRNFRPGISDLDIAIVSPVIYGKMWSELASVGARAPYFPNNSKLGRYMYHGWLRPDQFPLPKPQRCTDWEEAYSELQQHKLFRNKRLRLALYHSQYFLETYQQRGVRLAREQENI